MESAGNDLNDSNLHKGKRTRTGCWTCRGRRVKCDEQHPVCRRCIRAQRTCGYDTRLVWEDDARSLGICHGRTGVWSKQTDSKQLSKKRSKRSPSPLVTLSPSAGSDPGQGKTLLPYSSKSPGPGDDKYRYESPSPTTTLEFYPPIDDGQSMSWERLNAITRTKATLCESSVRRSLQSQRLLLPLPPGYQSSKDEPLLFSYYQAVICDTSTNSLCRFQILPMAFESSAVYHGILMLAAKGRRKRTPGYEMLSLKYQQSALSGLIQMLGQTCLSATSLDEALVLVVLLCACDIWDGTRPTWVKHFVCYRDITRAGLKASLQTSSTTSEMYKYFNKFFIYHLVMAKTAFDLDQEFSAAHGEDVSFSSEELLSSTQISTSPLHCHNQQASWTSTEYLSLSLTFDELDYIDVYTGFSDTLLLLINDIAELRQPFTSNIQGNDESTAISTAEIIATFNTKYLRLKTTLENLRQILPSSVKSSDITSHNHGRGLEKTLLATSEAYRYASLVLLSETFSLVSKSYSSAAEAIQEQDALEIPEQDHYITKTIRLVQEVVNSTEVELMASWPLWPLFIAGCCLNNKDYRQLITDLFDTALRRTPFGNLVLARKVVEMVWKDRDMQLSKPHRGDETKISKHKILASPLEDLRSRDGSRSSGLIYDWERVAHQLGWKLSLA